MKRMNEPMNEPSNHVPTKKQCLGDEFMRMYDGEVEEDDEGLESIFASLNVGEGEEGE